MVLPGAIRAQLHDCFARCEQVRVRCLSVFMYEKHDGRLVSLCVFLCFSNVSRAYRAVYRALTLRSVCVYPVFVWSCVVLVNLTFTYTN